VYPGGCINGERWADGQYAAITSPRAPLTVSLSLENFTGASVSVSCGNIVRDRH